MFGSIIVTVATFWSSFKEINLNPWVTLPNNDICDTGKTVKGLKDYINVKDVQPYIIVWFRSHDRVIACPASEALRIKADGNKSISLKMLDDKLYNIIEIPSKKLRTFLESDYTVLIDEVKE